MAFPINPNDQDEHTLGSRTFRYNAAKGRWRVYRASSTGSAAITQADLATAVASVSGGGTEAVSEITSLTLDSNEVGDLRYVEGSNKLFIWSGSAWQNIALTNEAPTLNSGGAGSYQLAEDGTPTVITLDATDPEGIPITWGYTVTDGIVGQIATITQNDNVFTITPSTDPANQGSFQLTFTGTDGDNVVTDVNDFQLVFEADPGEVTFMQQSTTWTVPDGVTNVSVVCIGAGGGGALSSSTSNSAGGASTFGVPGESFYFGAGGGGAGSGTSGGSGGTRIGAYDGGGNGGSGASGSLNSAGGGAGGYTGNGGSATGSGSYAGPGGGVGYFGQGANGQSSRSDSGTSYAGSGGGGGGGGVCNSSCGSNNNGYHGSGGGNADVNYTGAAYAQTKYPGGGASSAGGGGAGGGGALAWKNNISVTPGQQITVVAGTGGYGGHPSTQGGWGLVRIVWGDSTITRTFPTTNVGPTQVYKVR